MTAKRARKKEYKNGTVVYCGPTIPGVANQFTFYQNGVPAQLDKKAEESPEIKGLLIKLEDLPEAMKALQGGCGHIYSLYRLMQENFNRR